MEPNLLFPFRSETLSVARKREIKLYSFIKGDFLVAVKESERNMTLAASRDVCNPVQGKLFSIQFPAVQFYQGRMH